MKKINTQEIVENMLTDDQKTATSLAEIATGNEITDQVREAIANCSPEEIALIEERLERLLDACYQEESSLKKDCSPEKLFSLKESLIYYVGRITKNPDLELLKKIYHQEEDMHLLLNIAFSSLTTGDEEIESDFISRIEPGNDYDNMIRSWTLAFFANAEDPYAYVDEGKDWQRAKEPRLKRLAINDETAAKFEKAKAFRWLDLVVINLFLQNRGSDSMTADEYGIVENTKVDFPSYSEGKVKKLTLLKNEITSQNPYKK